jgi:predicted nuclease of restriction endonuclease-like (RecB) superfamily
MIKSNTHERQGMAVTNFQYCLQPPQSDLTQQALKALYIFDFLTLAETFQEHEPEMELAAHFEKFLLELWQVYAYVGRQYHMEVLCSEPFLLLSLH